jgi:5-methylcytosine-specific restriction endonuclease McrA
MEPKFIDKVHMWRKETYTLEQILPLIKNPAEFPSQKVNLNGSIVNINSDRLWNFKLNGIKCVDCGIEGSFFAVEKSTKKGEVYHLNLYAKSEKGAEVLMTKDHIIPKCMNGRNSIENYQVMCIKCNNRKGGLDKVENDKRSVELNTNLEKYTKEAKEDFDKLPLEVQNIMKDWSVKWLAKVGGRRLCQIAAGRRTEYTDGVEKEETINV